MKKNILLSKTFWVQAVTVGAAFFPQSQAWMASNPEEFVGVIAAVNVLIRFATSGKVTLI